MNHNFVRLSCFSGAIKRNPILIGFRIHEFILNSVFNENQQNTVG